MVVRTAYAAAQTALGKMAADMYHARHQAAVAAGAPARKTKAKRAAIAEPTKRPPSPAGGGLTTEGLFD